jgi:phosphatidylinositol kinase/protein kinase (PI-3  family)
VQQEMQGEPTKPSGKVPESLPESEADRAIEMVKRKLTSRLSAEADVRRLILEATDEGNLSRMYCGMLLIFLCDADRQVGQPLHSVD